ncbi:MAG: ATP-binding cassette domain-containing protein, partial [Gammaproteobacteria bacterium]|nr:ATP-binding cassette domain-containing protein [Gammaproteobacteria bacterium]NIV50903.1 ATP-binding cassette domain-containing protein [Gammaproteobacteria bacterium]NIX84773.1 ATP-binding cassette domain-containing protein [Gammaproteobacteria bacterium]
EFIMSLPEGYDTLVGERGAAMSAGERQRLAIARALLTNPAVLVLDEPTSALDRVTQHRVLEGYHGAMRDRTTVVITHRFELAQRAHRVLVIDGARVVEDGPPGRMLAQAGPFARLFR